MNGNKNNIWSRLLISAISLFMALSAFTGTAVAAGSVSGTISYSGSMTGPVYVGLSLSPGVTPGVPQPLYFAVLNAPGAYTINGVPDGIYYVGAIRTNSLNAIQMTDPYGMYGIDFSSDFTADAVTVSGEAAVTNKNFMMIDGTVQNPNPYYVPGLNNTSIQLSSATYSVNETGPAVTITATRTGGSSGAVGISYSTSNGSAVAGSDYTSTSGSLSWTDGDTASKTFMIPVINDALVEPNETFTVTLSNPTGGAALGSPSSATVSINNDDNSPIISFTASGYTVSESGKTVTITAKRTGSGAGAVGVSYATSNGTAVSGSDYTAKTGTLSWASGNTANKTFTVTITNDTRDEDNETFTVTLSNPTGGAALGTPAAATVTITDNDNPPAVQFSLASSGGSEATASVPVTVTLSAASNRTVTVNYATANGIGTTGATAVTDYTATSGTLTFNPGVTSQTITVPIINDANYEANETFTVRLSGPVNATLGKRSTHTRTITNDDAKPKVQFQSTSSGGSEATTPAQITVILTGASYQTISVNYATANGTATAGSDYTASTGKLTFSPGVTTQTINIPITNDSAAESNETFTARLATPVNATLGTPATHTYTINDNDNAGSIQLSSATYSAAENSGTVTITATRTGGSSGAVGISYATSNGTATAGSDYAAANGTLSWANGETADKTFAVTVSNDVIVEADETFTVTLSSPTGGATLGSPANATVTITVAPSINVQPLSRFKMTGQNFNTNADVTVRFFDETGYSVEVPAVELTSDSVSFIVPPFINSASHAFSAGTVLWEVIEVINAETARVSGSSPLTIGDLPALTMPPGTVLANYMGFLELYLADVETNLLSGDTFSQGAVDSQELRTALVNLRQQCGILKTAIRNAIANPGQLPVIGNFNGTPVTLDAATLTIADQFITAMAQGLIAGSEVLSSEQMVPLAAMAAASNPSCHLSVFEQWDAVIHSSVSETMARDAQARLISECADYYRSLGSQFAAVATMAGIATFLIPPSAGFTAPAGLVMGVASVGSSVLALRMDYVVKALKTRDELAFARSQAAYGHTTKQSVCFGVGQVLGSLSSSAGGVGGVLFDIISNISGLCDEEMPQWEQKVQTFIGPAQLCTSFTYTEWSACQPNNTKTREVATSSPAGCAGGNPELSQACTYVPPVTGGTYVGSFSGITYETHPDSQWKNTISATITVTVAGNGTLMNPYSGIMNVEGTANLTLEYCHSDYGCDPGGIFPLNFPGVVTGTFGKVEALATTNIGEAVISVRLTDGVMNVGTLTGLLNFDAAGDAPIIKNITLTK